MRPDRGDRGGQRRLLLASVVVSLGVSGCASSAATGSPAASSTSTAAVRHTAPAAPVASLTALTTATLEPSSTGTASTPVLASVVPSQLYESAAVDAGVVPWADLPYRPPIGADARTAPVGKPRWCMAEDLHLGAQSGGDAAADMRYYSFPVTVRTGVRCSLQGYPVIHLASPTRAWSATSVPLSDFAVPPGEIVDSRHPAAIEFRWVLTDDAGYATNTQTGTVQVTVDLLHAGGALTSSMNLPGTSRPNDPPRVGRVLAEPLSAQTNVVYGGLYLTGLGGRIRLSTTSVRPGSTFTYQVWVTGEPAATALLPGCAGYRERLVVVQTGATLTTEDHQLNCEAVRTLPSYGRLFSMQIQVPAAVAAGSQVELEWEPDTQGPYPEGISSSPTLIVK